MATTRYIEWTVSPSDLNNSPLGYEVDLLEPASFSLPLATHDTFARTQDFAVDIDGSGKFSTYPYYGLIGATTSTVVRMLLNGENPSSCLVIGSGRSLFRMSLDCQRVLAEKVVCADGYAIDCVSSAPHGSIWVKDTSGAITVFDGSLRALNQFKIGEDCIFVAADPFRNVMWKVTQSRVSMIRTKDLSISFTTSLPMNTTKVLDWDVSRSSGRLFMVLDGTPTTAVSVGMDGTLITFSSGASSICQWGAMGALACVPGLSQVDIFESTSVVDNFKSSRLGLAAPSRISSLGTGSAFVVDVNGKVAKANDDWGLGWSLQAPWVATDVFMSEGEGLGAVVYLASLRGVVAYRDMLNEGWPYGETIAGFESPIAYPVATAITGVVSAHAWAKPVAVESSIASFRESSSSSSSSSNSSKSSRSSKSSLSSPSSVSSRSSLSSLSSLSSSSSSKNSSSSSSSSISSQSSVSSQSSSSSSSSVSSGGSLPDLKLIQVNSSPDVSGDYFRGSDYMGQPAYVRRDGAFVIYCNYGDTSAVVLTTQPPRNIDIYYGIDPLGHGFFVLGSIGGFNGSYSASYYHSPGPYSGSASGGIRKKIVTGTCSPDVTGEYLLNPQLPVVNGSHRLVWSRIGGSGFLWDRSYSPFIILADVDASGQQFQPSNYFNPYGNTNMLGSYAPHGTCSGNPVVAEEA